MSYEGKERRESSLSLAEIKNTIHDANKEFFDEIRKMCDDNIETEFLKHTTEYPHFDKPTRTIIYEIISNFKRRIKIEYVFGVPLTLLFIERLLNRFGVF